MTKFIIALSFAALAQSAGGETTQAKASRDAISKVLVDQVNAWNQGDLNGFLVGYHRSKDTTFYTGSTVLTGWDAVLERYQKQYQGEGKEMGKLNFRDVDVQLLGSDSALVRGQWHLTRSMDAPSGLFTLVFRKTAEGWRIVHDHTSQ